MSCVRQSFAQQPGEIWWTWCSTRMKKSHQGFSRAPGHGSVTAPGWSHKGCTGKGTLQGMASEMGIGFEWICCC